MRVYLIPRVCEGLTDQSKCKELLLYCDPSDHQATCTVKLIVANASHGGDYFWPLKSAAGAIDNGMNVAHDLAVQVSVDTVNWFNNLQPIESHIVGAAVTTIKAGGAILSTLIGG